MNGEVNLPVNYMIAGLDAQSNIDFKRILDGYKMLNFRGSFTAFDTARNSIREEPPDIAFIVMDRAEVNAYQLLHEIRALNLSAKVIFLSRFGDNAVEAFSCAADGFILMPFNGEKIKQLLMRIVDQRRA